MIDKVCCQLLNPTGKEQEIQQESLYAKVVMGLYHALVMYRLPLRQVKIVILGIPKLHTCLIITEYVF